MNPGRQAGRLRSCAGDDVDAAPCSLLHPAPSSVLGAAGRKSTEGLKSSHPAIMIKKQEAGPWDATEREARSDERGLHYTYTF